jgi:hypothetical protein
MNIYKTSDEFAFRSLQGRYYYDFPSDSICPVKISVSALAATVCSIATDVLLLGVIVKAAQGLRVLLRANGISAENVRFAFSYAVESMQITILKTISCCIVIILPDLVHTCGFGVYLENRYQANEYDLLARLNYQDNEFAQVAPLNRVYRIPNPQPAHNNQIHNLQPAHNNQIHNLQPAAIPDVIPAQPVQQENNLNQQQAYMLRYVDKLHGEWLSIIEDGVYDNDEREASAKTTREAIELLMGIVYEGTCNNAAFKVIMEIAEVNQHIGLRIDIQTQIQAISTAYKALPTEVQNRLQWHLFNDEDFLKAFNKLPSQGEQEEHKALINIIKENLFHIHKNVINPALRENTDDCYTAFTKKLEEISNTPAN